MTTDQLRLLAAESAATGNRRATFEALRALREGGEPDDYFLGAARGHRADKWLAYHAIIVLGADAVDDEIWATLQRIRSETSDAELLGAVDLAGRVRYLEDAYQGLGGTHERLDYVLSTFRTGWNQLSGTGGRIDEGTDPQAVWSQRTLRELSEEYPRAAAAAVAAATREGLDEAAAWQYRRFLAGFLADDARARFRELDPEA